MRSGFRVWNVSHDPRPEKCLEWTHAHTEQMWSLWKFSILTLKWEISSHLLKRCFRPSLWIIMQRISTSNKENNQISGSSHSIPTTTPSHVSTRLTSVCGGELPWTSNKEYCSTTSHSNWSNHLWFVSTVKDKVADDCNFFLLHVGESEIKSQNARCLCWPLLAKGVGLEVASVWGPHKY